jgi:hypothetical protein
MKTNLLILLFAAMNIAVFAQTKFQLPHYTVGHYERTVAYTYFGGLSMTGKGNIALGGSLPSKFITGVKFYMLVDSIKPGVATGNAAFKDSAGVNVPMRKGDKLPLPINFQLYSGKIGLSIVIEGKPAIIGESYFCDITANYTLDENWGILVSESSQNKCVVDFVKGIETVTDQATDILIYPNPATDQLTIKTGIAVQETIYRITDRSEREVQNGFLTSQSTVVDIHQLQSGDYFIQVGTGLRKTFKIIKN